MSVTGKHCFPLKFIFLNQFLMFFFVHYVAYCYIRGCGPWVVSGRYGRIVSGECSLWVISWGISV